MGLAPRDVESLAAALPTTSAPPTQCVWTLNQRLVSVRFVLFHLRSGPTAFHQTATLADTASPECVGRSGPVSHGEIGGAEGGPRARSRAAPGTRPIPQWLRTALARPRRPRPGSAPCSRASCGRARSAPPADCPFACRSAPPWFAVGCGCRRPSGPGQYFRPSHLPAGHTVGC